MCRSAAEAGLDGFKSDFEKNFYHEHPDVSARTQEEVENFRKKKQIIVEGDGVPRPITVFEEASFPGALFTQDPLVMLLKGSSVMIEPTWTALMLVLNNITVHFLPC